MRVRSAWACAALVGVLLTATACDSFNKRVIMKKANEHYRAQRYEQAITEYQKVLAIDANDWDANYLIAVSYLAMYHPGSTHEKDVRYAEEGIKQFEKLLTLKPPSQDAMAKARGYYLGLLDAAQKPDKAVAFLEGELKKHPGDPALIGQIADLYLKKGDFPNSLRYLEQAATLNPNKKEAWYTIGVACWARSYHGGMMVSMEERAQVVDRGIEALNKALAIDPEYFDALSYINLTYREKAKVLAAEGKAQEASDAILKAEEYTKKAMDVRKKLMQAQGAPAK